MTALLLAAGMFTACSGVPSEAGELCGRLDGGVVPIQAIGQMPGADLDPNGTLARARDAIRSTCPQHEAAAASADAVLGLAGAPEATPPVAQSIEMRVEGTASRAQVTFGAGGSNGGGDLQRLPWSRTVTVTTQDVVTLSAVTPTGSSGAVACTITDTATGEILSRQVRESGGGSMGYASVVCSSGQFAGPRTVDPPLATTTAAKPTTTTPTRKTRDAADAESDRIKSCMVKTGQTEAQCRDRRGESKAVTDSRAVGGGLAACIDQTGMTEAQCRAASAAGLGG
ncbi:hypothetical protein [Actinomycetospora sp. CA-084318]|uniref:hypothetical protein n=1 Tax=Actinomycetospora sp. CA-084318 TaxID=3239892 RepID=UPI003D99B8FB